MLYFLAADMKKRGWDVFVILPQDGFLAEKLRQSQIRVIFIPLAWWLYNVRKWNYHSIQSCYSQIAPTLQSSVQQISRIINDLKIDLVCTNTLCFPQGALAARKCKVPHLWYIHELLSRHRELRALLPVAKLYQIIHDYSDQVIAVSKSVGQEILAYIPGSKLEVLRNAIKLPHRKEESSEKSPDLTLCYAGSFTENKGVFDLLKTAKILNERGCKARFVMAGPQTDNYEKLHTEIKREGLTENFEFVGLQEDVFKVMARADAVVSASYSEPFGLTLLEAMACSKPVIATRSGGPEEIVVDGQTGLLVPPGDCTAMALAIERIAKSRPERERMGRAGFERVQKEFSHEAYLGRFEKIVEQIILERKSRPSVKAKDDTSRILVEMTLNFIKRFTKDQLKLLRKKIFWFFKRGGYLTKVLRTLNFQIRDIILKMSKSSRIPGLHHKVSIIIPLRTDRESVVIPEIEKLLTQYLPRQTYQNYEAIVVLDGPSRILESRIKNLRDPRIRVYSNPMRSAMWGHPETREGLRHAEGEYFVRMNHDNRPYPDYLETLMAGFENGLGLVYGRVIFAGVARKEHAGSLQRSFVIPADKEATLKHSNLDCMNYMVRMDIAKRYISFWTDEFAADWRFVEGLMGQNVKMKFVDRIIGEKM